MLRKWILDPIELFLLDVSLRIDAFGRWLLNV